MNIQQSITQAAKIIPIYWPLRSMIAVNPLWDLKDMSFIKAVEHVKQFIDVRGVLSYDEYIRLYQAGSITKKDLIQAMHELTSNRDLADEYVNLLLSEQVVSYCTSSHSSDLKFRPSEFGFKNQLLEFLSGYFDSNQQGWYHETGKYPIFDNWRKYAIVENRSWGKWLHDLPEDINQALESLLLRLKIAKDDVVPFFTWSFAQLLGWNSFIKWLQTRPNNPLVEQNATLAEILLIWCCLLVGEKNFDFSLLRNNQSIRKKLSTLVPSSLQSHIIPNFDMYVDELCFIWQRAYEIHQHELLFDKIKVANNSLISKKVSPNAQFVFCIDTRSEGIRRHLEKSGKYETFGFAGFFGSVFALQNHESDTCSLQAPALVEPNITLSVTSETKSARTKIAQLFEKVAAEAKENILSPFAFFEMVGNVLSLPLLAKTLVPKRYHALVKNHRSSTEISNTFLKAEHIESAADSLFQFLKTIGLINNMAPVVVICGHGAQTENNPFQASFDCGACGGNSGAINAEVTCEILNNPHARALLTKRGVSFGSDTVFIPALHNTTTDELIIRHDHLAKIPFNHTLTADITAALAQLKAERTKDLPAIDNGNDRHVNWAELIPEWGLANNMAIIIGPRRYTANLNLNRRVFLHSYDHMMDEDGTLLASILNAPVIVAHWINSQYYFSATDPDVYGSGNKAIHNVVGKVGVMEGNLSDLKIGLPTQSVFYQDRLVHQPLRLLVVIYAPRDFVNTVLNMNPNVKSLFDNNWLTLNIVEPEQINVSA